MDTTAPEPAALPASGFERGLLLLSKIIAIIGGVVLIGLTLTTVYSIIGRAIARNLPDFALLGWWGPIRGDFELIEMGTAVAIFSFLPYTQLSGGNVLVDFFTLNIHPRFKSALALFSNLLFTVIAALFTWRMALNTQKLQAATFKQTTMILHIPTWWGYLVATIFMAFLTIVCLYTAGKSLGQTLGEGEPVTA
jgi:TRAP-type C4-dicarboxylate transport system permease small subunit